MPTIIKQQQNLCCLFAIMNIFNPQGASDTALLQDIITSLGINVKKGMTLVEENNLLAYITNNTMQLTPLFLNLRDRISEDLFSNYFKLFSDGEYSQYIFGCSLIVDSNNINKTLHRIWAFYRGDDSEVMVLDTKFEKTRVYDSVKELWEDYTIKGIFIPHSVSLKKSVLFNKEDIKHLLR